MKSHAPTRLPAHARGLRIGLFGGSFNPPHAGHALVAAVALRRLGLDRVWLMVSPGNPLKETGGLAPLDERLRGVQGLSRDPRLVVTGFEAAIGARYTIDSVDYLLRRCPGVKFVWIMGADNLAQFHLWRRWRAIARKLPIAVIDRPGSTLKMTQCPAARWLERFRLPELQARLLVGKRPPAIVLLHARRSNLSSSALRAAASIRPDGSI